MVTTPQQREKRYPEDEHKEWPGLLIPGGQLGDRGSGEEVAPNPASWPHHPPRLGDFAGAGGGAVATGRFKYQQQLQLWEPWACNFSLHNLLNKKGENHPPQRATGRVK